MQFFDKAERKGFCLQFVQAMVHRGHVVDHFAHVHGPSECRLLDFILQQVGQRGLGSFDLAGEHGFLADVHRHEKVGVGEYFGCAVKPADGPVRFR